MGGELLLDTGAFVALVDRSEQRHLECVDILKGWERPILSTEAVLTETLYLVGSTWRAQRVCLEFFLRGAFVLVPSSVTTLRRVASLMEKFKDVPMDFADGTLVALAEDLGTVMVFTLDLRGFSTYRLHGKKSFRLLP